MITLSSASLAFGNQAQGTQSAAQTETLTNKQGIPLTINSVVASAGFSVATNTCGTSIGAGTTCAIGVTFSPTALGSVAGTLTITDAAGNSPQTASLTGTGIVPVTLSSGSLNLGTVAVGNTSTATTVQLTNQENVGLNFTKIAAGGAFSLASNNCGSGIAAGATCTIGVKFSPTVLGPAAGTVTFTDNAVSSPQSVALAGTGSPAVTLSSGSLTFASTRVGTASAAQAITLTNNLNASLAIGTIGATGDFTLASNTCGSSVAAGLQCQVGVTFTPTVVGARSGILTMNFGAFGSPALITLSGAGNVTGLTSLTVTPADATIPLTGTKQYVATGKFSSGSTQNLTASVTWSSSATGVATINASGLASAVAQGSTTVLATLGAIQGSTSLTVGSPPLVSIAVTPAKPSIPTGSELQFTAFGTYADNSTQDLTNSAKWKSSATAVATINATGLTTSVKAGPTMISAAMGSISGSTSLTVFQPTTFYVAPNGNDQFSGTLSSPNAGHTDGPFASPAMAQSAVRSFLASNPAQPVAVQLRSGTYYLPSSPTNPGTLNFTSADSGTANTPVVWQNYPGETPIVSGGMPLGKTWTHVSGNFWQTPLPANTQPFEYLYYNNQRRMRSRVAGPTGVGYYMNGGSCYSTRTGQTVAVSQCNLGTFLRVAAEISPTGPDAGCPSVTMAGGTQSKCLDRFGYNPSDPIGQWINLNSVGSRCGGGPNPYPAGDIELTLFEAWTVELMRISCVDTTRNIIYFTGATNGNPSNYAFFGPAVGHRYVIENTRDAFNAAQSAGQTGIWFLDRSTSPWTLNYLANSNENPNTDTVAIAQQSASSLTGGSLISATNLSYVTFQGITFAIDNFIPPATGFNQDNNGENSVPAAIDCESCQNVTFDSIVVRHTSASGIQIASTSGTSGPPASNDVIQNSAFYDIGSSGIHIGHQPLLTDRAANVVQFITVQNNIVQGYSRVLANGEGIAQGNGHDVTYQHNDITDGYHAGISICNLGCPSVGYAANGVNIVSQYNHIWNVIQGVTSDGGTLYYNVGSPTGSGTGNKILNNLLHDVTDSSILDANVKGSGYGGHGIYLDIQTANVDVENNVVYRMAGSTVFIHQGPAQGQTANTFRNNIFAYGRLGMFQEQNAWPQGCNLAPSPQVNVDSNIFYFDLNDSNGFYVTTGCANSCGLPFNMFQGFQGNLYWRTDGGFASYAKAFHVLTTPAAGMAASSCGAPANPNVAWTFLPFSQWQSGQPLVNGIPLSMNEDVTGTATVNPGFGTSGLPTDYQLSSSPIAGFSFTNTNDTILQAGRSSPAIVPPNVPETYPTYSFTQY